MRIVQVIVDSRIRLSVRAIGSRAADRIREEFTHRNPQRAKIDKRVEAYEKSRQRTKAYFALKAAQKQQPAALASWRVSGDELSVARGGMSRLRSILGEEGFETDEIDRRVEGTGGRHDLVHRVELWEYQHPIVDAVLEVEQGIVRSPTGSGKTTAVLGAIAQIGLPSLIVVTTNNQVNQWIRRARVELGLDEEDVGIIRGSERRIRPITIGSQRTLWKCARSYAGEFGVLMVDEVHLSAAKTFVEVVDVFPARYRIGVSDDERRQDRKEFLIYDQFGEVIAQVDPNLPVQLGKTLDVEVRVLLTDFDRAWWHEASEIDRPMLMGRLIEEMTEDRERNALATSALLAEVAAGHQVLALSHRVEHCHRIRADVSARDPSVGLLLGGRGENEREFERTVAGLMRGAITSAVGTYQAVGTALDLPSVSRGVAMTPIHKNRYFLKQVKGRICRSSEATGKEDAVLWYLLDWKIFGKLPLQNLCKWTKRVLVRVGEQWVEGREMLKRGFDA